ncbi:ATP-binding protein [Streptomyces wedmorensis]|uniref:ATP-binding protein n=1 Tax=Streptomyces wedmorensis TaxID=43759 RepID=A0ABW6J5Q7_STRWE
MKLLAVSPGNSLHREEALEACWPDTPRTAALGSLRVALHAVRRALEPELAPRTASSYVISDGLMLRLAPEVVWIDADHAEAAALAALDTGDVTAVTEALERFTGELLPEDRYAAWAQARRDHLTALRERLLLGLGAAHLRHGALGEATDVAEQVLAASPAEEVAHQLLIEAYVRGGQRRRAVRQYHLCREALDQELGVRPGPVTERLHQEALATGPALSPTAPSLPRRLRRPPATPLRGREEMLRWLSAEDGPPVRILTGEAGVGKTRLVGEAARLAAERGTAVLWGGGHDAEGHTPYGAFAEALDGWFVEREVAERARVGAEYPELASLLPVLGQVLDIGGRSPEEERDRLFRATAGLYGDLAARHPVLTVLDDLHAADAGSFQLLGHLARRFGDGEPRLRFLVICREGELSEDDPRRNRLAALLRQRLAVRKVLVPLREPDCIAVAQDVMTGTSSDRGAAGDSGVSGFGAGLRTAHPSEAPPEQLRRVWELSAGNPLFAVELARGLVDRASAGAPEGVRQLVAERLGRLDRNARRVVEMLSAAGGEAALAELLDVAAQGSHPPMGGAEATDALDRALRAGLVEERQVASAGRPEAGLAFRHPLVRLTCYDQLTVARRRQLHAAYAQAVLRRRPDAVDALASHFSRADDPRAAEYLRQAAERAAALHANDTADRYYRDLVDRLDIDAARARLAHAQVLRRMGHFAEAAEALRAARAEFGRRGDHDDEVLAAAHLAETLVKTGASEDALATLAAHPPGPATAPEPAAVHHLAHSVILFVRGRYEEAYEAALCSLRAAEAVQGVAGQGLLARSYAQQASSLGLAGRFAEAREAGDLALGPAEAYGDPTLLGGVLSILRENARRGGRLREAVATGQRALELAERSGDPTAAAFEQANLAELHLLLEEFGTARSLAEASVGGAEISGGWCLPYALAALARVRLRTDAVADVAELLDRAERQATALGDRQALREARTARAELALRTGRPEQVEGLFAQADSEAPLPTSWALVLSGGAEAAHRLALTEVERAERTGERLAEVEALAVSALAAARLGSTEESDAVLTRAERLATALPYPAGVRRLRRTRELCRGW